MSNPRVPLLRSVRPIVYVGMALTVSGTVGAAFVDQGGDAGAALLEATQLLGLEALGFLLASMCVGPLTAAVPRLPFRAQLQLARRALGVSAYLLAGLHATLYLVPALLRDWHELIDPGWSWVAGLVLGAGASAILLALAVTSRDAAVRSMTGRRWKQLHRLVYLALPAALAHAVLVGSDFALRPAIRGVEGDAGCLIGFALAAAGWFALFMVRRSRSRRQRRA